MESNKLKTSTGNLILIAFEFFVISCLTLFSKSILIKFSSFKNIDNDSLNLLSCVLFMLFLVVVNWFFQTKLFNKVRNEIRKAYYNLINFLARQPLIAKKYTAEERSLERFKKEIEEQLVKSRRIYFRLLSGHTMFHDKREKFILDTLRKFNIEDLDKRDIKIQLLKRDSVSFQKRAQNYVKLMQRADMDYKCSYEEYMKRCEGIESQFIRIFGTERIAFYHRKYLWRLHIFDDIIFISTYSDNPELTEGHLSPAYSFTREYDSSLFDGFVTEFNSLYDH